MGRHYKETDLDRILSQPNVELITLCEDGKIIAMAFTYIIESLTRKALIFEEFIVDSQRRGKGLGGKLLEEVIKLGQKNGVDCIECSTKETNRIAKKLYLSYGFKDRKNLSLRLWL